MKRVLTYVWISLLVCSCRLEDPVILSESGAQIEFTSSRMRIITKAGDQAQKFGEGTKFRLFAVHNGTEWSQDGTKFYNLEGNGEATGKIEYSIDGKKASYDVGENLDFYGVTYGSAGVDVEVEGKAGEDPIVKLELTDNQFQDLMYSSNLKNKNSASGLLHMEFRHTMAKLKFEVLKQNEDEDTDKQLENVVLTKVMLKGSAHKASFNAKEGVWTTTSINDRSVFNSAAGMKIEAFAQRLQDNGKDIEILVVPNTTELFLDVTVDVDGNTATTSDLKTVEYKLMANASDFLRLEQNHEYTLSIVVLKNDVRIVTVTPKVYDWVDIDMGDVAYFGQPVYFGGLMWMDRNLGAQSADCENDWYNSIGYYYQHGRNIPYKIDVDVWKTKYNTSSKVNFSGEAFADALIYTLDQNNNKVSTYISATSAMAPSSNLPYYDDVAKNPGDDGVYSFICGFNSWSSWARGSDNKQDVRNDTYWDDVERQPCPKGWRLPTRKDMYRYLPEEFVSTATWFDSYTQGTNLMNDYHSGTRNSLGEEYQWKYFTAKFKASSSGAGEWSYPISDSNPRVYMIKYEGSSKAYRIMIEQRKANTVSDGSLAKYYVRIARFDTTKDDRFLISSDGKQWNLHKFDWDNPAEYMDFPLCGYIDPGDGTNSIISNHPYLGAFGNGCILRSQEIDTSGSLGRNWTMYFMNTFRGVTVGGGSRRTLGDQIRCVRDINAK